MLALQLLINGLTLGAAYALVALGFVLVLNATGAVNFAQGDMVMAGGYIAVALAGIAAGAGDRAAAVRAGRHGRARAPLLGIGLFPAEDAAARRRLHQHDRGRHHSAERREPRLRRCAARGAAADRRRFGHARRARRHDSVARDHGDRGVARPRTILAARPDPSRPHAARHRRRPPDGRAWSASGSTS